MVDIIDYINLTDSALCVKSHLTDANSFNNFYKGINENEKKSLLRHFIINNTPYLFIDKPILFEQLKQYLADKLNIAERDVLLIGSGKTGFSVSPPPEYGRTFGTHSDLDFSIVNEVFFYLLEDDFYHWQKMFDSGQINPSKTEEKYWIENIESVIPNNLSRGFIDTYLIPNRVDFQNAQRINNSLSLIKINLAEKYGIKVKNVSVRVFKDWKSFFDRLVLNTSHVMSKVK